MPETVTSPANPALKRIRALDRRKEREAEDVFIAEGAGQIARAIAAGWRCDTLVMREGSAERAAEGWAAASGARVIAVPEKLMASLSGMDNAPAMLAVIARRWGAWPQTPRPREIWIGLDRIRDPGNLGTIIRTAEAAGAAGLILIGPCCDAFAREAVRASTGSIFGLPLLRVSEEDAAARLKDWPGDVIATRMDAPSSYAAGNYKGPVMLLMGSESDGLAPALSAAATRAVAIPMAAPVESLNVAAASAILLYALRSALSVA